MKICKVIGNVWATRKEESLRGHKLMIVQPVGKGDSCEGASFVAVDCVSAGIGENVLVTLGSSARKALENREAPVDAAIVGIIDGIEEG